jgi:glycosyltransferase involved in cell wall biosynthesis
MKVLVFSSLYPNNVWPYHGVFIKERMSNFARLDGNSIKVIAPVPYFPSIRLNWRWRYSQVVQREVQGEVEVYHPRYFITPKVGMTLYGLMMFLSVLSVVRRVQKDFDFDLIDAHYVYPDGFAAVLLGRFFNKPVVVSARGSDINLYAKFPVIRRLLQYTLSKADRVISVCQALKQAMVQLRIPGDKICVIPNGVDTDKFYPVPKQETRSRLGLDPDRKIILSVGGMIPRKGFDLLIRAVKILIEKFHEKNITLIIVGDGTSRRSLEGLVSSLHLEGHVLFTGAILHQELYSWYSAADLFCLASSREGWPNVLLESIACGTPVVATDIWGIPEVICSDKVGLLTQRNEREIAEKIYLALKRPWQYDALIQYAREHSWAQAARLVSALFESVLEERGKLSGDRTVGQAETESVYLHKSEID